MEGIEIYGPATEPTGVSNLLWLVRGLKRHGDLATRIRPYFANQPKIFLLIPLGPE